MSDLRPTCSKINYRLLNSKRDKLTIEPRARAHSAEQYHNQRNGI